MNTELPENNRWRDFNWRGDQLYILDVDTGLSIVPDNNLWRVRWPDGVLSADVYNKTRARENARTVANRIDLEVPGAARGCV